MRLQSRFAIVCVAAALGLVVAAAPAVAQTTITTSTTVSGTVSYAGLTVGGVSPGPTLTINAPAAITVTASPSIIVGSNANPYATVIQNGGSVVTSSTVNSQLYLGLNTGTGNTAYTGSASYTLNAGTITLGGTAATTGILGIGRSSDATFTQNGGSITAYRNDTVLFIASGGNGSSYTLTGGTFEGIGTTGLSNGGLGIASNSNVSSSGTLTINGAGATVAVQPGNANLTSNGGTATVNLLNGTLALNGEVTRGTPNSTRTPGTVSFTLGGGTLRPYSTNLVVGSSTAANTAAFDITLAANSLSTITGVGWKSGTSTVTIVSNIVGSGSIQFTGGTVALSGSNTYTGNTTVDAGTLRLDNINALRGSTFAGGAGTLAFGTGTAASFTFGGLAGSSAIALTSTNGSSVNLSFGANNANTTYSGNVTGTTVSAGAGKVGSGTTTISGNWTLGVDGVSSDGAMAVSEGELRQTGGTVTLRRTIGSGALLVAPGSGTGVYTVESGTVVAANSNLPGTANARIGYGGGTGILTINGASASVRLSGTNNNLGGNDLNLTSGTGRINLSAGELAVNSLTTGTVAGSAGAFNFSGGTLRPFSQNTSIGSSGTGFTIALAGTSATLSGIDASGTSRSLTILTTLVNGTAGAAGLNVSGGTVVLSAANTYSGATTVNSGTLAIGAGGTTGSITGNVANNATLVFNRSNTITYSGTISGSGDILKQAAGQLTLSASNSFTGNTTVNSGTLLLGNQNALRGSTFAGGAGTLAFTSVSPDTTLNYYYLGGLSGSSSLSLLDTSAQSIRLNFGFNNADTTFSGNLTNGQGIEKYGTGTTTLSGNISTGAVFGQMSVGQGGLRQTGGTITLNRNNGSGAFTVGVGSGTTGSYVLQSGTLLVSSTLGHVRLGGNGGNGMLTINGGSARAFFSGTNNTIGGNDLNATSGTGTINLIAGELAVNSLTTGTAAGSTGNFDFAGGTLRPYSQNASIGRIGSGFSIALAGSSATFSGLDAAAGTARTLTVLTALVDGTAGAAGAIFSGGTISLSAANTYSGATTIAGANSTLALGANGSFANSPTITVGNAGSSGAILDLTAKTGTFTFTSGQTVGGIGTIKMDAGDTARFAGTFAPGNSPGILTFDGGTGLLSGTTQIELFGAVRGTGYDAVDLINAATLNYGNGVLALDFGSWLADQQSYQLFGSGSSTLLGDFASVTIAGTNYAGLTFTASNGVWTSQGTSPANQTLTFTEATGMLVIVPEPGAIALAGIGIAAAAWVSRRRR